MVYKHYEASISTGSVEHFWILWPDLVFPFSEETIESPFYSSVRQRASQIFIVANETWPQ